jgi:glycosyltransferase involved in cell wall biosynthesis
MSLRVLFVASGLGVGGAERALERLLPALQTQGIMCAVVSLREPQEVGASLRELGIEVFELGMRPSRPSLSGLLKLLRSVRAFRPDVIQGWMYHGNLAAQIGRLAAPRAKVVLGIHQTLARLELESRATRSVIRLDAWLSRFANRVIYVAQAAKVGHEQAGYAKGGVVLPNGLDVGLYRPDHVARAAARVLLKVADDELLIGMIGRFHPSKNHVGFLSAAAILAARHVRLKFVLIGQGVTDDNPAFASLLSNPSLRDRVFMLGARADVPQLLPALDLYVLSSIQEALPNVVAEAMSCGVPCVVTDVGDAAWMVGVTGWVAPTGQYAMLAETIEQAIGEGREALAMRGQAARKRVEQELAIGPVSTRYAALYQSLG